MGEFLITVKPVSQDGWNSTNNTLSVSLYNPEEGWGPPDTDVVPLVPSSPLAAMLGVKGIHARATTYRVEIPGQTKLPTAIYLRISGDDGVKILWAAVAKAPTADEDLSSPCVAVFDWGPDGHALSTDTGEGSVDVQASAIDMIAPTGVWQDYLILIETRGVQSGDGTESPVQLTLYDINANPIGAAYNIQSDLQKQRHALATGSITPIDATLPSPTWNRGSENPPFPGFLTVSNLGSDAWRCERIWVLRRGNGPENLDCATLARFEIGQCLSTDKNEGVSDIDAKAQGYEIRNTGEPTRFSQTFYTRAIANAADLTTPSNEVTVEIEQGFTKSISLSQESGDKNANSISVGATVGYSPPSETGGASGSITTTYNHEWESWKSRTGVSLFEETSSQKRTASLVAPAHTIRLSEWAVTTAKMTVHVSNGFGAAVALDLVPKDGLGVPSITQVDVCKDNKISHAEWNEWKEKLLETSAGNKSEIDAAEAAITRHGWFSDEQK